MLINIGRAPTSRAIENTFPHSGFDDPFAPMPFPAQQPAAGHDFLRSRWVLLQRVPGSRRVAMSISGHKTASVFQRYNIVDERDITEAGRKLNEKQKSNALLEIPFGQSSGMISTTGILTIPRPSPCLRCFLTS
jgi:hypothetical protein